MTQVATYKHSAADDTITLKVDLYSLKIKHRYENKQVIYKDGRVYQVEDSNRVGRIISMTAVMPRADYVTLEGLLRPASAPDYTTAYPQLTTLYIDKDTNIGVVEVCPFLEDSGYKGLINGTEHWWVKLRFEEKNC